jgi:hypothetical protein
MIAETGIVAKEHSLIANITGINTGTSTIYDDKKIHHQTCYASFLITSRAQPMPTPITTNIVQAIITSMLWT